MEKGKRKKKPTIKNLGTNNSAGGCLVGHEAMGLILSAAQHAGCKPSPAALLLNCTTKYMTSDTVQLSLQQPPTSVNTIKCVNIVTLYITFSKPTNK